jgi:hypothetical protein
MYNKDQRLIASTIRKMMSYSGTAHDIHTVRFLLLGAECDNLLDRRNRQPLHKQTSHAIAAYNKVLGLVFAWCKGAVSSRIEEVAEVARSVLNDYSRT